jgi:hypothetical protein
LLPTIVKVPIKSLHSFQLKFNFIKPTRETFFINNKQEFITIAIRQLFSPIFHGKVIEMEVEIPTHYGVFNQGFTAQSAQSLDYMILIPISA